jgi:hypothetical protein
VNPYIAASLAVGGLVLLATLTVALRDRRRLLKDDADEPMEYTPIPSDRLAAPDFPDEQWPV